MLRTGHDPEPADGPMLCSTSLDAVLELFEVFDCEGYLGRLFQYGGHRAVFFFRQTYGVLHRFVCHFAAHTIHQLDLGVNLGEVTSTLRLGGNLECGKRLPFLAENPHDVACCAAAQRDQDKLDRRTRALGIAGVHNQGMTGGGLAQEAVLVGPDSSGFYHAKLLPPLGRSATAVCPGIREAECSSACRTSKIDRSAASAESGCPWLAD